MKIKHLITLFLFAILLPGMSYAQSGKITGKVIDAETKEPIIGATVGIKGTTKGAITDLDGNYLMLNVAPGTYTLEARYIGYATVILQEVIVRTDLTTEQDFELSPEVFEGEEVVVTAERKAVLKDVTSSESRVSSAEIEKLPVQEVSQVVQLQAGVNVGNNGAIHIRGGRASEVSYVVDGIRVTDDYDRSQGIRLENAAIQELQVISGSFNAEYGQAMSGIINVVTKAGGNEFEGSVRTWGGGYLASNKSSLYPGVGSNVSNVDPFRQMNIQASVSGPIIKDKLTFFTNIRRFENEGWLTGYNAFSPHGAYRDTLALGTDLNTYRTLYNERVDLSRPWYSLDTTVIGGNQQLILRDDGTRDSSLVNMNNFESLGAQANLQFRVSNALKFNLIGNYGEEISQGYDHTGRLVPGGRPTGYSQNYALNFKTTITPSNKTFITLNFANRYNGFKSYLYEDAWDPRYFNYENIGRFDLGVPGNGEFRYYGTNNNRFFRSTETWIGKAEISSQVNDFNFIKAGINVQSDIVKFDNINLSPLDASANITIPEGTPEEFRQFVELGIPQVNTPGRSKFSENPINFSGYIQDKIEYESMIINVGVRFDYFDPNARVPSDPEDPDIFFPTKPENRYTDTNGNGQRDPGEPEVTLADRQEYWFKDASPKYQLSPRLGIAFPINDNGVIYFSYGYFFQIPSYNFLYTNSRILLTQGTGNEGQIFGNPDLEPERSIQYELGFKQEIFSGTAIEVTGYYKDTRDYVSSRPQTTGNPSINYGIYFNRDYSRSAGFTFALNQYVSQRINFGIDYTFGAVEGSNSDPSAEFFNIINSGSEIDSTTSSLTKLVQPLDWDRRHIVNGSLFYSGNTWGANVVGRFYSGTPYTPAFNIPGVNTGLVATNRDLRNTARLPARFTMDFNAYKNFEVAGSQVQVFLNIFNLLDLRNVNSVYNDSGQAELPLPVNIAPNAQDGFYANPTFYDEPRRVQFGVQLSF
ncbi:TonB-dependent receptor [Balneola sp. MJW-20]|uniref:TonB-dependent receptor n=1 Tax=Gracilimonas aurantiaca TaxID=3234185 RepID=UPI0034678FCD